MSCCGHLNEIIGDVKDKLESMADNDHIKLALNIVNYWIMYNNLNKEDKKKLDELMPVLRAKLEAKADQ